MSRPTVMVAVVAGVVATVVAGRSDGAVAVALGVVVAGAVGLLGGVAVARHDRRRVDRLARDLTRWLGQDRRERRAPPLPGDWRGLGPVLDDVGARLDACDEQLRQARPWRHDLVASLAGPAILFDRDGYVVSANRAARDLLRIPAAAGRTTVIQALGSVVLADAVARARRAPGHVEVDAELGAIQVHASVSEIADETLMILSDRTRERRVEELRRSFVVNASHELQTPATSIQTLSEALEITAGRDPDRLPDLVARLREEAERLVRLVHDLLDLRRLEDRGDITRVPLDLADVARTVIADLHERADERSITLGLDAPESVPVSGDPDDLRLVLRNLVANAIQYNRDRGEVSVRLVAGEQATTIEVADTGIGIPQQELQRVFERFHRVDVARSRQTGGTGLGLSIVRHAVERHRGTIRVDSLLGEGTTFTVTLPAAADGD